METTSSATPATKIAVPPKSNARPEWTDLVGTAAPGAVPAAVSVRSIASPQWIQNFHVGATGDPHPTQVSITSDCMGVAFWL
jgi:hypothetical protein